MLLLYYVWLFLIVLTFESYSFLIDFFLGLSLLSCAYLKVEETQSSIKFIPDLPIQALGYLVLVSNSHQFTKPRWRKIKYPCHLPSGESPPSTASHLLEK